MSLVDESRRLLRSELKARVGVRPIFDAKLRLLGAPTAAKLAVRETQEVRRARQIVGQLPVAEVATIIPTYRRPALLRRAVESALAQTVTDQIVVVVDDGAGLSELPKDPRLVAFSLSRNCGVSGVVRNVGIAVSRSTYLAFLDDDNEWEPDHLEVSLAGLSAGADLTYTALRRVLPDGTELDVLSWEFDRQQFRNEGATDTNTIVVRRDPSVRFSRVPRGRRFPIEDWELVWRLSRRMQVRHIPQATVRYLVNPDSYNTAWQPKGD